MSGARQKIDRQTLQLFDNEVDRPEHDQILTTLFRNDSRLNTLLMRVHNLRELATPTAGAELGIWTQYYDPTVGAKPASKVSLEQAINLAGPPPEWTSLSPIRELQKTLEHPLYMESGPRSSRVMGFIDLLLRYQILSPLYLMELGPNKYQWETNKETWTTLVEVKSQWPSAGNLLRQLNLYAACMRSTDTKRVVIGPDDSMNDLLCEHGWRLVTFSPDLSSFQLMTDTKKTPRRPSAF